MSDAGTTAARTSSTTGGPHEGAPGTDPAPEPSTTGESHSGGWRDFAVGGAAGWVVAVVVAAIAIVAAVQWFRLDGAVSTADEIEQVVGETIAALTNWDAQNLEPVRTELAGLTTSGFRDEAEQLLDEVSQGLEQARAQSTGEILDLVAEVQTSNVGGAEGEVVRSEEIGVGLALVQQGVTNLELAEPDVTCWAARAITRQVDGRWLVDDLELYGPNTCPAEEAP